MSADGVSRDRPVAVTRTVEEVLEQLATSPLVDPAWAELELKNRELEQSQGFINDVLASMSDVLIVSDAAGSVCKVNKAVVDLTGFAEPELLGRPVAALFAGGARTNLAACAANCACPERLRQELHDCEARLITRDGRSSEPVTLRCQTRLNRGGRVEGLVIIGRPVGELRRAYEALNHAHRELVATQQRLLQTEKMASIGRLVAGVAHELNNPVSFVYGNVQVLQRYRERLERYVGAIHAGAAAEAVAALRADLRIDRIFGDLPSLIDGTVEGAERIRDIVQALLTLSFRDGPPAEPVDLAAVAGSAAQWAMRDATRHPRGGRVALTVAVPPGLVVMGRAGRLHQVLVNLLTNAIDAAMSVEGPRVVLAGAAVDGHAVLTVRDTGPGIDATALGRLFEPFFTTKPVGRGTGLGLWVSYEIVQDHGGRLDAANHPEGGAIFTLTLPLAA